MRTRMTIAAIVAFLTLTAFAAAQNQPANNSCSPSPSPIGTGVCPPTGTSMGQSDYQRASHEEKQQSAVPLTQPLSTALNQPPPPIDFSLPDAVPSVSGAGAELYETTPMPSCIAVDSEFVYVLRGNEVVKLKKSDMSVVSTTKLPPDRE